MNIVGMFLEISTTVGAVTGALLASRISTGAISIVCSGECGGAY